MDALRCGRKDGANFLGIITDGDYIIERLPRELVHGLRAVARNIEPDFFHHGNGLGPYVAGFCPGAEDLKSIAPIVP
jgi:hypothetical protein